MTEVGGECLRHERPPLPLDQGSVTRSAGTASPQLWAFNGVKELLASQAQADPGQVAFHFSENPAYLHKSLSTIRYSTSICADVWLTSPSQLYLHATRDKKALPPWRVTARLTAC